MFVVYKLHILVSRDMDRSQSGGFVQQGSYNGCGLVQNIGQEIDVNTARWETCQDLEDFACFFAQRQQCAGGPKAIGSVSEVSYKGNNDLTW